MNIEIVFFSWKGDGEKNTDWDKIVIRIPSNFQHRCLVQCIRLLYSAWENLLERSSQIQQIIISFHWWSTQDKDYDPKAKLYFVFESLGIAELLLLLFVPRVRVKIALPFSCSNKNSVLPEQRGFYEPWDQKMLPNLPATSINALQTKGNKNLTVQVHVNLTDFFMVGGGSVTIWGWIWLTSCLESTFAVCENKIPLVHVMECQHLFSTSAAFSACLVHPTSTTFPYSWSGSSAPQDVTVWK